MKQIFTLFTAAAVFFTVQANAQLSQNFNNGIATLASNCWVFNGISNAPTAEVIDGGSISTLTSATSDFASPYVDLTGSVTVTFRYRINSNIANNSYRTLEVGTKDVNGNVTIYKSVTHSKDDINKNQIKTFSVTFTTSGTRRIFFRFLSISGDGNTYMIIDDLVVTGSTPYHYNPSACNSAPTAVNDNFSTLNPAAYSGNVLGNDSDPNVGESITASLVSAPASTSGTVSMSANGNFTFTPAPGFTGGPVTFTYNVRDNGYDPLSSNTATVTITYPEGIVILPVQLVNFSSSLINNKAQLKWSVEENETGSYFEIEKSTDGKNFASIGVVMISDKAGAENYTYTEASELIGEAYYRLKTVNNNKSISQSRIIVLKNSKEVAANRLTVMQNPVASTLAFNYTATKAGVSMINMYNLSGVKVYSTKLNTQAGMNSISLSVDNKLTSGAYVLEVVNGLERNISKIIKK